MNPTSAFVDENGRPISLMLRRDANGFPVLFTTTSGGAGGGGGGLSVVDEAAFTPTVSNFTPAGGVNGGGLQTVPSGVQGTFGMTAFRAMQVAETDAPATAINISAADSATTSTTGVNGQTLITGTPTANSSATFDVNGDSTFMLEISGVWAGSLVFEKAVSAAQYVATGVELVGSTNAGLMRTLTSTSGNMLVRGNIAALGKFRVRATSLISGQPIIKAISGTGIADVQIGTTGQVSFAQPNAQTATWTTATGQNTEINQTCAGYGTAIVTTIETGTTTTAGGLIFEGFDGTNWWPVSGQQIGNYTVQSSYTLVNNTSVGWSFDIAGFQRFRVRLASAITGTGSPQVIVSVQVDAMPNVIAPTVGWAQKLDNTNDSITAYPFGHSFANITTATTTTVKSGAGVLHGYVVNTDAASGTITFYDNTAGSGTKIGTITNPVTLLQMGPLPSGPIDIAFSTGLTIVTTGTQDITVSYR